MDRRAAASGRSTKKSSSKRPRRSSSGGRRDDVVGGGHGEDRAGPLLQPGGEGAQQPGRPRVGPLPRPAPGEGLLDLVHPDRHRRDRLGGRQRTGQVLLGPLRRPSTRGRSSRSSGTPSCDAATLAASDLPQPCTPTSSTPRGAGRPNRRASGAKAWARSSIQDLKLSSPPRASAASSVSTSSRPRSRERMRFFSSRTMSDAFGPSAGSAWSARRKARRACVSVSPRAATRTRCRSSGLDAAAGESPSSSAGELLLAGERQPQDGRLEASPSGSARRGATMARQRPSAARRGRASRIVRTTAGSAQGLVEVEQHGQEGRRGLEHGLDGGDGRAGVRGDAARGPARSTRRPGWRRWRRRRRGRRPPPAPPPR